VIASSDVSITAAAEDVAKPRRLPTRAA